MRNLVGNNFPQHPTGQISSKFHQCNFCHGEWRLCFPNRICFSDLSHSISALSGVDVLNDGIFRVLFTSSWPTLSYSNFSIRSIILFINFPCSNYCVVFFLMLPKLVNALASKIWPLRCSYPTYFHVGPFYLGHYKVSISNTTSYLLNDLSLCDRYNNYVLRRNIFLREVVVGRD